MLLGMRPKDAEAYLAKKEKIQALALTKKKQDAPIEMETSFFRSLFTFAFS